MEHGIFFEKHTPSDNYALLRDDVPSMNLLRRLAWMNPGTSFEYIKASTPCERKTIRSTGEDYIEDVGYGPRKASSDWNGYSTLIARKEQFAQAVGLMIVADEETRVMNALCERVVYVLTFCDNEKKRGSYSDLEYSIAVRDAVAATWILTAGLPALRGASQIVDEAKCKLVSFELGPRDDEFAKTLALLVNYTWNATPAKANGAPVTSTFQSDVCSNSLKTPSTGSLEPPIPIDIDPTTAKKIILGKSNILERIGLEDQHWDFVLRSSKKENGPIMVSRGGKAIAEETPLLIWWNSFKKRYEDRYEKSKKVHPLSISNYGRHGTVVHEVGGHVKSSKSSKSK